MNGVRPAAGAARADERMAGNSLSAPDAPEPAIGCTLFGLTLENTTLAQAAATLIRRAETGERTRAFFVNAHCINTAAKDHVYFDHLQRADLRYADGIGMKIAARLRGVRLADNVNGTDLFPLLCRRAAAGGIPVALLGARPGVAKSCARKMRESVPDLRIPFTAHGYHPLAHQDHLIDAINRSGARILLVGMGVPAQEKWIGENADRLHAPLLIGVGALFDFYAGRMPRAPLAWRRMGMEWLFRLLHEPDRLFSRYVLGNPAFIYRALKQQAMTNRATQ